MPFQIVWIVGTSGTQQAIPTRSSACGRGSAATQADHPGRIELWPSSTLFRAGAAMRRVVMGADPFPPSDMPGVEISRHPDRRNGGRHLTHAGGQYDSHLLVPVTPTV